MSNWWLAIRPRTLPASLGPVLVGNALAWVDQPFAVATLVVTLFCAMALQVSVNLANDYFDFVYGVDNSLRVGPVRATQGGLLRPAAVRNAMVGVLCLAIVSGLYLVQLGGWPLLVAGLLAILTLLAYSGGPFRLASHGLGEVAVFVFFGPVAVAGSYFAQTGAVNGLAAALSVAAGLPITAILVVNNLRDLDTDAKAGKMTLAVRIGEHASRREFALLIFAPFLVIAGAQFLLDDAPGLLWLPILCLPAAGILVSRLYQTTGSDLNPVLAHTSAYSLLFCLALSAGVLLG